jgi:L-threonylcarbamoyladenylate synthase
LNSTCSRVGNDFHKTMTALIRCVEEEGSLEIATGFVPLGEAIVIPTETIFGLTCDAENKGAVENVYEIKGRASVKPSAVFVPSTEAIAEYAQIEHEYAERIVREFLPGPLTIVVRSKRKHWPGVVGEDGKIGIRVSSEPFIGALASSVGKSLLATSANRSGLPDCLSLSALIDQFGDVVPLILYRQKSAVQQASTVIDMTGSKPILLRAGAIVFEEILKTAWSKDGN